LINFIDIEDKTARVRKLAELVRGLPKVNYELLRVMSKHLRRIVRRAQENKMTIRNGELRHRFQLIFSWNCVFTYVEYPGGRLFSFHYRIRSSV
jgi:RhoGAP domain